MVREAGEIYLKLFVPLLAEVLICAHMLWEDLRIHNVSSVLHLNFLPVFSMALIKNRSRYCIHLSSSQ